jgi:hypothetical protein
MWLLVLTMEAMMSEPTNERHSVQVSPHLLFVPQESCRGKDEANQEHDGDEDRAVKVSPMHLIPRYFQYLA